MNIIGVAKHLAPYLPSHPVVKMHPKFTGNKVTRNNNDNNKYQS